MSALQALNQDPELPLLLRVARYLPVVAGHAIAPVLTNWQRFAVQFIRFKEQQRRAKPEGPVRAVGQRAAFREPRSAGN